MLCYSSIREIKILDNPDEVNKLLKEWWELLELYKNEYGIMFVLGRNSYKPIEDLRDDYQCEGAV